MISTKEIEDFVNGATDERSFLVRVAKDTDLDDLSLLNRVESVSSSLNLKLRHEVSFCITAISISVLSGWFESQQTC